MYKTAFEIAYKLGKSGFGYFNDLSPQHCWLCLLLTKTIPIVFYYLICSHDSKSKYYAEVCLILNACFLFLEDAEGSWHWYLKLQDTEASTFLSCRTEAWDPCLASYCTAHQPSQQGGDSSSRYAPGEGADTGAPAGPAATQLPQVPSQTLLRPLLVYNCGPHRYQLCSMVESLITFIWPP